MVDRNFFKPEGRHVVAALDGGALILGKIDRAIRLTERFAACFTGVRTPQPVEHEVSTL